MKSTFEILVKLSGVTFTAIRLQVQVIREFQSYLKRYNKILKRKYKKKSPIYSLLNQTLNSRSLETWSRSRSRDPLVRVSVSKISGLDSSSVSKATDLGLKPIVLRLWILQQYGLAKLPSFNTNFCLLYAIYL